MNITFANKTDGNGTTFAPRTPSSSCTQSNSFAQVNGKLIVIFISSALSIIGNSLILSIIIKFPRMRTSANLLIANVAASDTLAMVLIIIRTAFILAFGSYWPVDGTPGLALCMIYYILAEVCYAVSIFSMLVICIERFIAIMFPFKARMTSRRSRVLAIFFVWFLGIALFSPYFYTMKIIKFGTKSYCLNSWRPKYDDLKVIPIYWVVQFTLMMGIPLTTMSILYGIIIHKMGQRATPGERNERQQAQQSAANKRLVYMFITVVLVFVSCIGPTHVLKICVFFVYMPGVCLSTTCLNCNTFLNPLVYFVFSNNFRTGLRDLCCCKSFRPPAVAINLSKSRSNTFSLSKATVNVEMNAVSTLSVSTIINGNRETSMSN